MTKLILLLLMFSNNTFSKEKVGIMTFNVENLFDTKDDAGKNDYTFLPLSQKKTKDHIKKCDTIKRLKWKNQCLYLDWSEENLKIKMNNLAASILNVNEGMGPDILILQEVENLNVLNKFINGPLKKAKYLKPIIIEGDDIRGIDVAILTRLELSGTPKLHKIPFKGMNKAQLRDSRGILQADLILSNKKIISVFANHFPAPYHPKEFREQGFRYLSKLLSKLPNGRLAVAGGDFNLPLLEDKKFNVLKNTIENSWIVGHKVSCKGCKGTTYYPPKDSWSFLDMIFLSKSFNNDKTWMIKKDSVTVANKAKDQITKKGHPFSYSPKTQKGVSDHWPLYLEIIKR